MPSKSDQQLSVGDYEDFHGSPDGRAKVALRGPSVSDVQDVGFSGIPNDPISAAVRDGKQAVSAPGDPVEPDSNPPVGVRGWIVWVWRKLRDIKNVLDSILVQLGGTATGQPVIVTELYDVGGKRPKKKKASVAGLKRVLLLKAMPPTGKKWFITSWKGSGTGRGFYEFQVMDETNKTVTLLESFDSTSGWTGSGRVLSITTDTVNKIQGSASLAVTLKFQDKDIQSGEKITKTISPTQDWSNYSFVSVMVRGDSLNSNVSVGLRVFQGASSYTFTDAMIGSGSFVQLLFDLSEITAFDLTAVSKIEFLFFENVDLKKNVTIRFDQLEGVDGVTIDNVDQFFIAGTSLQPNQVLFPEGAGVELSGQKSALLFVQNLDTGVQDFEVGILGRQSDP